MATQDRASRKRLRRCTVRQHDEEHVDTRTIVCGKHSVEIASWVADRAIQLETQWIGGLWIVPPEKAREYGLNQKTLRCFVHLCEAIHSDDVTLRTFDTETLFKAGILALIMKANGAMVLAKELIKLNLQLTE